MCPPTHSSLRVHYKVIEMILRRPDDAAILDYFGEEAVRAPGKSNEICIILKLIIKCEFDEPKWLSGNKG